MKFFTCLLFILWAGFAHAEEKLLEPSIDKMVEWIPEEVPRTVSFYFDTNGDEIIDLIIAYHLIEAYACKEHCKVEITTFNDHWILVSSIGHNPYSYYVIKEWTLWRTDTTEDWQGVKKSSEKVYKYKTYEDWYNNEFLKLWPEQAP